MNLINDNYCIRLYLNFFYLVEDFLLIIEVFISKSKILEINKIFSQPAKSFFSTKQIFILKISYYLLIINIKIGLTEI